jgi:cell division protein FtsZ
MSEELMPFDLPRNQSSIIKVLGVGGGGSNAVNHMFRQGIKDVDFVVCNTDAQALANSPVPIKVQLGSSLTEGRGAGNKPEVGREAAIENLHDVIKILAHNTKMIFITAGMGGGTGTGAAPVIAKAAKELGVLTIGIVTIPFRFEGQRRIDQAVEGINQLAGYVDSLLVINNEKLREIWGDLKVSEAFAKADNVLTIAAKGIAEIITVHGHLNVDFADVQTVMTDSGVALMGSAMAAGPERAITAIREALSSPLLNNNGIKGAQNILLNITSGKEEVTMDEISQINEFVQEAAGYTADLIWGNTHDESLGDKVSVTVIATGFETDIIPEIYLGKKNKPKVVVDLEDKKVGKSDEFFTVIDKTRETAPQPNPVNQPNANNQINVKSKGVQANQTQAAFVEEIEFERDYEVSSEFEVITRSERQPEYDQYRSKSPEKTEQSRKQPEKPQQSNTKYNPSRYSENVEDMEKEPAFLRQNRPLPTTKHSTSPSNVSRITLYDTEDNQTKLSSGNSYLDSNVD